MCMYICIERERRKNTRIPTYIHTYIHTYIYMYIYISHVHDINMREGERGLILDVQCEENLFLSAIEYFGSPPRSGEAVAEIDGQLRHR